MFQLHVFGGFEFTNEGRPLVGFDATRLQALLTYLVLRRHAPTTRQQIAYALWPDVAETQARSSLRQLFHQLRQLLPEIGHILLIDSIAARWQHDALLQVDVWQFQDAVDKLKQRSASDYDVFRRRLLETALDCYRGDLLPNCYDDWIVPEREQLAQHYHFVLEQLIQLLEAENDLASAIKYAQRLRLLDPLHEGTNLQLMQLLARNGDRIGALRVYNEYESTLSTELGAVPTTEMVTAYNDLKANRHLGNQSDNADNPTQTSITNAESSQNNLPISLTPFIGRANDLQRLGDILSQSERRLITIVGPGGCGKTRLAVALAESKLSVFRDGAFFVPLAPVVQPDMLAPVDALKTVGNSPAPKIKHNC